jgi:GNAT superfamily N-acetyltransferase
VADVRDVRLRDGRQVCVRPTRTSDSSADTVALYLCSVDYEQEMAFAVVVGPSERERIVAASSYYLSPATGLAEVAYMVDPQWQGAGLGGLLHARMFEYARARGVRGFRADVLVGNTRMMRVFQRAGHQLSVKNVCGDRAGDDAVSGTHARRVTGGRRARGPAASSRLAGSR